MIISLSKIICGYLAWLIKLFTVMSCHITHVLRFVCGQRNSRVVRWCFRHLRLHSTARTLTWSRSWWRSPQDRQMQPHRATWALAFSRCGYVLYLFAWFPLFFKLVSVPETSLFMNRRLKDARKLKVHLLDFFCFISTWLIVFTKDVPLISLQILGKR